MPYQPGPAAHHRAREAAACSACLDTTPPQRRVRQHDPGPVLAVLCRHWHPDVGHRVPDCVRGRLQGMSLSCVCHVGCYILIASRCTECRGVGICCDLGHRSHPVCHARNTNSPYTEPKSFLTCATTMFPTPGACLRGVCC